MQDQREMLRGLVNAVASFEGVSPDEILDERGIEELGMVGDEQAVGELRQEIREILEACSKLHKAHEAFCARMEKYISYPEHNAPRGMFEEEVASRRFIFKAWEY
jgi:hypothetical protein